MLLINLKIRAIEEETEKNFSICYLVPEFSKKARVGPGLSVLGDLVFERYLLLLQAHRHEAESDHSSWDSN